jgi:hypothetical protein
MSTDPVYPPRGKPEKPLTVAPVKRNDALVPPPPVKWYGPPPKRATMPDGSGFLYLDTLKGILCWGERDHAVTATRCESADGERLNIRLDDFEDDGLSFLLMSSFEGRLIFRGGFSFLKATFSQQPGQSSYLRLLIEA